MASKRKVVPAKRVPAKKIPAPKKPAYRGVSQTGSTRKKTVKPVTAKQVRSKKMSGAVEAVKNPAKFAGSSKVKTTAYSKRKPAGKPGLLNKIGGDLISFSPSVWATQGVFDIISGVDTSKPLYDKKGNYIPPSKRKKSRLKSAAELAFWASPIGATKRVKKIRNAYQAVNKLTGGKATKNPTKHIVTHRPSR